FLAKIWPKPLLNGRDRFAAPLRVIENLISPDLPDGEIFRFGVRKIESANARRRMHRVRFRQLNVDLSFGGEQIEERSLLDVVGTGRVARRRPDPAVFLANQIRVRQVFILPEAPCDSRVSVQVFGKGFRQSIGQRFYDDRAVIVMRALEFGAELVRAMNRHGETAQIILGLRRNKLREALIELTDWFPHLLSQEMKCRELFRSTRSRSIAKKIDIVTICACRPESKNAARS